MNDYLLFYPGLIILGLITSFTDLKFRLIKNKHLLYALFYGVAIYAYIFLKSSHLPFANIILNITIAACISYFLYLKRLWSTGDAKLFIVFSFLTPSLKYNYLFSFPTIVLFINTIIISLVFVIIFNLKDGFNFNKLIGGFISKQEMKKLLYIVLIAFSITWLMGLLFNKLKLFDPLLSFIIIYLSYFLIYGLISKIKAHKLIFILVLLLGIITRLLIQPQIFFSFEKSINYILMILKYSIVFKLLDLFFTANPDARNQKKDNIAFAPFIFLGAITAESHLIDLVFRLLQFLKS